MLLASAPKNWLLHHASLVVTYGFLSRTQRGLKRKGTGPQDNQKAPSQSPITLAGPGVLRGLCGRLLRGGSGSRDETRRAL